MANTKYAHSGIILFRHLSMISEARRSQEDQSLHEAHCAECTDVSEHSLSASDVAMHGTSCLNPIMTLINSF